MSRHRRLLPAVLAATLLAALTATAAPTGAAPAVAATPAAPAQVAGMAGLAADADASLLRLDIPSLSPALLPQTNVDLARSTASVDSDADLDGDREGDQHTWARAATTGTSTLLDAPLELAATTASAPEDQSFQDVVLPLDALPLLDLDAIGTSAEARWAADGACVAAGVPLSRADQHLADLTVLEPEPGQSLLEVDTEPGAGAADTEALTRLAAAGGDQRALQAEATTRLAGANLFNGFSEDFDSLVEVHVVRAPSYTATADGTPGGASVEGDDPVVGVRIAGEDVVELTAGSEPLEAPIGFALSDLFEGLDPLLDPLSPIVRITVPAVTSTVAPDGTSASVEASLVRVELLAPDASGATEELRNALNQLLEAIGADVTGTLLTLDLAPIAASVAVPAGGITCPGDGDPGDPDSPLREVAKTASAAEVPPGGEFDHTIFVPNRGDCTLTGVRVVDEITGPDGFEVIATQPPGATIDGGTVTFDLDDLAPGETATVTIRIRVPETAVDGDTFSDTATVTADCDGEPATGTDDLDDVPTVRDDFEGPCSVEHSLKGATHEQVVAGQTFGYAVQVFNSGADDCDAITVTDTLDDRVDFVSCSHGCEVDGQTVTWELDGLPGGSSTTLALIVRVAADATGTLANTAVITPDGADPVTVEVTGPTIGETSVPTVLPIPSRTGTPDTGPTGGLPGAPAAPGAPAGPRDSTLPRTGAAVPLAAAGAALLGGLGLAAIRRRAALDA